MMSRPLKIALSFGVAAFIAVCIVGIVLERSATTGPIKSWFLAREMTPSTSAVFRDLSVCDETLTGAFSQILAGQNTPSVAQSCLALSKTVQANRPLLGHAYYVEAAALANLGQADKAVAPLAKSVMTAPNESWLAERRALFRIDILQGEQALHDPAFWKELEVSMQRPSSMASIAQLYFDFEEVNERLPDIIENQRPQVQRAMLSVIRRMAQGDL